MKNRNGQRNGARSGGNGQASSARRVYTFADVFCGVGGMRLALERCDVKCSWACEPDGAARQTYWQNFGETPAGDPSTIDLPALPDADILCAAWRVERGARDVRAALDRTVEILAVKQPRAVLLACPETTGVAAATGIMEDAIRELTGLGYYVHGGTLDARGFGLPQNARSHYVVGFDRKTKFAFPKGRPGVAKLSDLLDASVPERYYISDAQRDDLMDRAAKSAARDGKWRFDLVDGHVANALSGAPDAIHRNILVEGRRKWRTLTQREWARLMGYPDSFILPPKRGKAYQLIGGGVPIPCAAAVVERMLAALPGIGCKPTYTKKNQGDKARALDAGSKTDDTRVHCAEAPHRKTNGRHNGAEFALATVQSPTKTTDKKPGRHSPLRYYGGKANIAAKIVALLAPHNCFVDTFGGGANILLAKPPGSGVEVLNDVDHSLVNFWSVLRNPKTRKRLIELVEFTPYSRRVFKECIDEMATGDRSDSVRWAWAFYVTSNQARNGWGVKECYWAYGKSFWNGNASSWAKLPQRLAVAAKRLKTVQVENLDWEDCIRRYDAPDTLFVMDPPYHSHTRVSPTVYAQEMNPDDHERLLKIACRIKGKALICGYRHPLYERLLKQWRRVELPSRSFASPRTGRKLQDRKEQVWMNYPQRA